MAEPRAGLWASSDAYDRYMGRWSRLIAPRFLEWLAVPADADWLDIGCGSGVLSGEILTLAAPKEVGAIDAAENFVEAARTRLDDRRFVCMSGSAESLPYPDGQFDVAVSGLVLNFLSNKDKAIAEMSRVVRAAGTVGLYVWDYAGHMQIVRYFFDAAAELDARAADFDDGIRAPICRPGPLSELFLRAGLSEIAVQAIDIPAAFTDFDDYWAPFLGGTGSAPKYCTSLEPAAQSRLREKLRERVPTGPDGEILMAVRAWAVKARVPAQ